MDLNTFEGLPLVVAADEEEAPRFGGEGGCSGGHALPCPRATPPPASAAGKVVAIAAGSNHSLALTAEGRAYQWGQRLFLTPSPVDRCYGAPGDASAGEALSAASLSAGDGSVSAVVDARGRVFSWGKNMGSGVLGHYGAGSRLATCITSTA
jgi:alpha-tubulin suppressor-like RCC1 family protein